MSTVPNPAGHNEESKEEVLDSSPATFRNHGLDDLGENLDVVWVLSVHLPSYGALAL